MRSRRHFIPARSCVASTWKLPHGRRPTLPVPFKLCGCRDHNTWARLAWTKSFNGENQFAATFCMQIVSFVFFFFWLLFLSLWQKQAQLVFHLCTGRGDDLTSPTSLEANEASAAATFAKAIRYKTPILKCQVIMGQNRCNEKFPLIII